VKLFFDEDLGKGVAIALHSVGVTSSYVGARRMIRKQTPDEEWIPVAGREGWLVITANRGILRNEIQRDLWVQNKVGGVFLTTGQIRSIDLLKLILGKLDWLEALDSDETRPFAFTLSPSGSTGAAVELG
jgi:hypothetical protein